MFRVDNLRVHGVISFEQPYLETRIGSSPPWIAISVRLFDYVNFFSLFDKCAFDLIKIAQGTDKCCVGLISWVG